MNVAKAIRRPIAALALCFAAAAAGVASAEERIALVIGNGAYAHLPPLPNPANDAELMAGTLEAVDFQVSHLLDADRATMVRAIEDFGNRLRDAGPDAVGLFFYAGHGVGAHNANWLIPLGQPIETAGHLQAAAVSARQVLQSMERGGDGLNIVILDACRNPVPGNIRSAQASSVVPGTGGFVQMGGPSGSLIAYSTALGLVAYDGEGRHSPYAEALAREIAEPGVRLVDVFRRVRVAVERATLSRQTPWESGSLRGQFYFRPPLGGLSESVAHTDVPARSDGWVQAEGRGDLRAGPAVATKQALLAAALQALDTASGARTLDYGRLTGVGRGRFIRQYDILSAGPTPDRSAYAVRMRALVDDADPSGDTAVLQPFVTLMGSPKVLFILSERRADEGDAHGATATETVNLELEQGDIRVRLSRQAADPGGDAAGAGGNFRISSAEQFMAQRFRAAGYQVVTSDDVYRHGFVDDGELRTARRGVGAFAARVGKAADADLVIAGNVRFEVSAIPGGGTDLEGGQLGAVALTAKVIAPSTGKVLNLVSRRERFLSVAAPSALLAREESLERASVAAADELTWQIPSMLAAETRDVSLELRDIAFAEAESARRFLATLPGIDGVRMDGWKDKVSRYAIASRYAGPREYDVAGALQAEFGNFEVVEIGHYKVVGSF